MEKGTTDPDSHSHSLFTYSVRLQALRLIAGSQKLQRLNLSMCCIPRECHSEVTKLFASCPCLRTVDTRWAADDNLECLGWVDRAWREHVAGVRANGKLNANFDATISPNKMEITAQTRGMVNSSNKIKVQSFEEALSDFRKGLQ